MDIYKSLKELSDLYDLGLPEASLTLEKYERLGAYDDMYLYESYFDNTYHYYCVLTFSEASAYSDETEVSKRVCKWTDSDAAVLLHKDVDDFPGGLQEGIYIFEVKRNATQG